MVGKAGAAQYADDEVGERGYDPARMVLRELRGIFVVGHVTPIVQPVLNAPMAAAELEQRRCRRPLWRQTGEPIDDLPLDLPGGADAPLALQPEHLPQPRPVAVAYEISIRRQRAPLLSPVPLLARRGRAALPRQPAPGHRAGIELEHRGDVPAQRRLIRLG